MSPLDRPHQPEGHESTEPASAGAGRAAPLASAPLNSAAADSTSVPVDVTFARVTKFYGAVIGLNDFSCRIGPGITGLFGANGAGKSTLMKLASGQLRPSQGEVRLGPLDAWNPAAKRLYGYSPDLNSFYEDMPGREFVLTMARLHGFPRAEALRRTAQALEMVGMADRAHRRLAGCSHGMRQRIKLAQALVHDPPVLLLDEPFTGIDPGGRHEMGTLLRSMADAGKTVLVSTHILAEIEELVDTILIVARGRLVASGTLSEIRTLLADHPLMVEIVADDPRRLAGSLFAHAEVVSVEVRGEALVVRTGQPSRFFALVGELVVEGGHSVRALRTLDAGADAIFEYLQQGLG